jgi:thiamine-phosphate pyrophosphorylase
LKFPLPKIYPITDTSLSGLSHLEQVKRLIEGGATLVQLRDKTAASGDFYRACVEVLEYARPRDVKIIVNDRVDIATAAGADGVHLGQDDLPPEHARKLLGPDAIIGFSTHSIEQAQAAIALPVDYIAIGPIYSTTTKENPDPVVGIEGLKKIHEVIGRVPLVAIGGIDRKTAPTVLTAGADSVAIISDIISRPDAIADTLRNLLNAAR